MQFLSSRKSTSVYPGLAGLLAWLTLATAGAAPDDFATHLPHLHLAGGPKLTLLGVTYGTHHFPPNFLAIGGDMGNTASINSRSNSTVVWLEIDHPSAKKLGFELLAYDAANTACVVAEPRTSTHVREGVDVDGFMLDAYPRTESNMVLRFETSGAGMHHVSSEKFVITNPAPAALMNWPAEALPKQESDGDLTVNLTQLVAPAPLPGYYANPLNDPTDPLNQCVRLAFDVSQSGHPARNWRPVFVETSDAMGNRIKSRLYRYSHADPAAGYFYQPLLWQAGPAWKVRLELSRASGFRPDEIVTLTNLLVKTGGDKDLDAEARGTNNVPVAETTVKSLHLQVLQPILYADADEGGKQHLRVLIKANPNPSQQGIHFMLLKATDEQNKPLVDPISPWATGGGFDYIFEFVPDRDVKTLNLAFAVNQSRFVEYTVKPEKP